MQELKKRKIWVCWNYIVEKDQKKKKPVSAYGTETGPDAAHAHTWVTYEEAKTVAEKNSFDGISFVILDGYFFLDIDHRDISDPLAALMLERFHSYAEKSGSGSGIHIYSKCDRGQIPTYVDRDGKVRVVKEFYVKNPHNEMELYIGGTTNRFAVYTGNVIMDEPLSDCT